MEWVIVIVLLFALLLIVLEVAVIPGTTIVGIGGIVLLFAGVSAGFYYLDGKSGWAILGITTLSLGGALYFIFKTSTWKKISLNTTSLGRLGKNKTAGLEVGLRGVAISSLRPSGKAEIKNKVYEVKTFGEFVSTGTGIQIVQVTPHQIIVKSI